MDGLETIVRRRFGLYWASSARSRGMLEGQYLRSQSRSRVRTDPSMSGNKSLPHVRTKEGRGRGQISAKPRNLSLFI
jgi:hypothetical protein